MRWNKTGLGLVRGAAVASRRGEVGRQIRQRSCGLVGMPNVGKSTLFNALTRKELAEAQNYPFCTIEV